MTQLAGDTVNAVLSGVAPLVRQKPSSRQREAMLAALNGVLGDDLQWRCHGDASAQHSAHDHGLQLAAELGYTPLYLHYNTGRHISANGQQLADLLEQLLQAWPQPVQELTLLTHSMGGLVARSACHYGELAGHAAWRRSAGRSGPRGGSATRQQPRHAPVCRHRPDSQRRHP